MEGIMRFISKKTILPENCLSFHYEARVPYIAVSLFDLMGCLFACSTPVPPGPGQRGLPATDCLLQGSNQVEP